QRKLVCQLARKYLIAYLGDEVTLFRWQYTRIGISISSGFFQVSKRFDDFLGHGSRRTYFEIIAGTLRLCAPVLVGGYLHLTHRIVFYSVRHGIVVFVILQRYEDTGDVKMYLMNLSAFDSRVAL